MSEKNPKISVIIPTYNRAHLIGRAIQSVLNQTYQDFELIIVDDGSTDNTEDIIKGFQKYDKRIKYIKYDKNQGSSAARNRGIQFAKGGYIAFLDSDDEWLPEKLEKQIELFEKSDNPRLGFVGCNSMTISGNTKTENKGSEKGNIFKRLLSFGPVLSLNTSSVMIKRNALDDVGFFDPQLKISQDIDMWIRIAQKYDFDFAPELLFYRYIHSSNITTLTNNEDKGNARDYIIHKHREIFEKNHKIYSDALRSTGTYYIFAGNLLEGRKHLPGPYN